MTLALAVQQTDYLR